MSDVLSGEARVHFQAEYDRLNDRRKKISEEQELLHTEMTSVSAMVRALEPILGNAVPALPAPSRTTAAGSGAGKRSRRGSKREEILQMVSKATAPLTRSDIIQGFGGKGDKSVEMSISNALTALTKSNQLVRTSGDGNKSGYRIAA